MNILTFTVAGVSLLVLVVASVSLVPWIGHLVVKIITLGRVDLGWRPSDLESEVSTRIGFFVLLVIAGLIAAMVNK